MGRDAKDKPERCTILVIEDDGDIRNSICDLLEGDKFSAVGAANGKEALAYLNAHLPPSVILLDLKMPEMDGPAFRSEMKKDAIWSSIPVVVMSAGEDVRKAATQLDAFSYVSKPIDAEELLAVLAEACCQSQRLQLKRESDRNS
jgi:CheY-like chemotaxis protein